MLSGPGRANYPGGMLKRVAVATVFANPPRVLLMDEPFAALDYVTKLQLHQLLLTLSGAPSANRCCSSPRMTTRRCCWPIGSW